MHTVINGFTVYGTVEEVRELIKTRVETPLPKTEAERIARLEDEIRRLQKTGQKTFTRDWARRFSGVENRSVGYLLSRLMSEGIIGGDHSNGRYYTLLGPLYNASKPNVKA